MDRVDEAWKDIRGLLKQAAIEEFRARQIMDTANDAVVLINGDSIIQSLNGTFTDVFGYTADELIGKSVNLIMPRRYADHHEGYVRRYLDTGESHILGTIREVEALHKDGHEFPVELSMSEMIIGKEHFFVGMLRDISARKDMEAALRKQRSKTLALLRNMLPPRIAQRLMDSPNESIADRCENVTILFADIVGFTPLAGGMDAGKLVSLLNAIFSEFDVLAAQYQVEKIKTIGDAIMCAAGLKDTTERPLSAGGNGGTDESGLERMARMALEMHEVVAQRRDADGNPLRLRIGIHHGVVVAGVIGKKKFLFDLELRSVAIGSNESTANADMLQSLRVVTRRHKARRETILRLDLASISVFDLQEEDGPALFRRLVEDLGLDKALGLDLNMVEELADHALRDHREVPYHNRLHAMDVSLTTHALLKSSKAAEPGQHPHAVHAAGAAPHEIRLTEIDRLALMLAAVCHGLLKKHPKLQALASMTSVEAAAKLERSFRNRPRSRQSLEAHHANRCVELLERHLRAIAPSLIDAEILHIQKLALESILDTNMDIHEEFMARFKAFFSIDRNVDVAGSSSGTGSISGTGAAANGSGAPAPTPTQEAAAADAAAAAGGQLQPHGTDVMQHLNLGADTAAGVDVGEVADVDGADGDAGGDRLYAGRQLLCGAILKVADLGNAARPFADARRWARRIVLELGLASAAASGSGSASGGASCGPEADLSGEGPLSDEALAGPQDAFLRRVALPLFETVARILPEAVRPMLERAAVNADAWSSLKRRSDEESGRANLCEI
eukprot:tig00020616_g12263.t1